MMKLIEWLSLMFFLLMLVFALREGLRLIFKAIRDLKANYQKHKLKALTICFAMVMVGMGPFGHYAIEFVEEISHH